ncbi:MAG TPA: ATP-binding protein [Polyangiaceae bacterium]
MNDATCAKLTRRMTLLDAMTGVAIQVLTVAELASHPRRMWISIAAFFGAMVLNVAANFALMERWGAARTDLMRVFLNLPLTLVVTHFTGWPIASWIWLPYSGMTFVASRRVSWSVLVAFCVGTAALALHDGVPWTIPAAFVMLAVVARTITGARLGAVVRFAEKTEAQRAELDEAHRKLKAEVAARETAEHELAQAHKLEAIGRLASGVAHEMNTPLQFVSDSVTFLEEGTAELLAPSGDPLALADVRANMPEALRLVREGLGRATAIVASLRELAHPAKNRGPMDVNHALETALTLTKHEYKYVADVELALGDVPAVDANAGEINQVLVNLVVNAAHAIGDRQRGNTKRGRIVVSSERSGAFVAIRVADDGIGIDDSVRDKIFEPFFTTKDAGRGTGQGLAIARAIVDRHGGTLSFTSTRGAGTTFVLRLPCARVVGQAA